MYSSLKLVAGAGIVLSFLNVVAGILCLLFVVPFEAVSYTMAVAFGGFLFSTSVIFLLLSFYLFSLYTDLSAHEDSNFSDISSLRKRVDAIEKKIN